jgi:hypothetical protein
VNGSKAAICGASTELKEVLRDSLLACLFLFCTIPQNHAPVKQFGGNSVSKEDELFSLNTSIPETAAAASSRKENFSHDL